MRVRNAFSTTDDNPLMGWTPRVSVLREHFKANGGTLGPRARRKLRRYMMPHMSTGTGAARRVLITIPLDELKAMPAPIKSALRDKFRRADADWFAARPWINTEESRIDHSVIDAEMGGELGDEEGQGWEVEE